MKYKKLTEAIQMESKLLNTRNLLRNAARSALLDLDEYWEDPDIIFNPAPEQMYAYIAPQVRRRQSRFDEYGYNE